MKRLYWKSAAILLIAAHVAGLQAVAQQIDFPASSPVDQTTPVRAHGLSAGADVILRTAVVDASGQSWTARAKFQADAQGTVDTARHAPLDGSYQGVHPGGLFNLMRAEGDDAGLRRFALAGLTSVPTTITLESANGALLDTVVAERYLLGPGVQMTPITDGDLRGRLFRPAQVGVPGIVVLGGSDGGYPDALAALLASNGYTALSIAYFGVDDLPDQLADIPLEYIHRAIAWLETQPGVLPGQTVLFGVSKGAEAALLAASHGDGVRAVVAYAPSSVAWSCICDERDRASWT